MYLFGKGGLERLTGFFLFIFFVVVKGDPEVAKRYPAGHKLRNVVFN